MADMLRMALLVAIVSVTGCGTDEPTESPSLLESCGAAPRVEDYATMDAWRDEALVWMACARFSCSTIVVDTKR